MHAPVSDLEESSALSNEGLLQTLRTRFEKHPTRHGGVNWDEIAERVGRQPEKLWSLAQMERTGGEPDVVVLDGEVVFVDCAPESPKERRSLCYDRAALDSRKEAKPDGSAVEGAGAMGIEILMEAQYRALQELGEFDQKTSSWLRTPEKIRRLGGAIFADRRYDTVFVFHNGAESYYASRGFRGVLRI